ncbi:MAG: glucose-6-phosphate isomerase [Firmicutes bacterium]|nr:glucose-6-phosphate isomerase [Bacillota bacterium]
MAEVDLVNTGLPLRLGDGGQLYFREGLPAVQPSLRPWEELRPVLKDPGSRPEGTAYLMYRDVCWPQHRESLEGHRLRYDLTVIPAARAGKEPVRTHGHYHATVPGSDLTYPELYHVVCGEAWFLLQRPGPTGATEVVVLRGRPGQYVLVPPGYGHVTVNVGKSTLVIANWVERHFASSFSEMRARGGAAYHVLDGPAGLELVPNPAYGEPVPVRMRDAFPLRALGLAEGEPSYPAGVREPERLGFLVDPGSWRDVLARAWQEGGLA